jgi:hypothetical protein
VAAAEPADVALDAAFLVRAVFAGTAEERVEPVFSELDLQRLGGAMCI